MNVHIYPSVLKNESRILKITNTLLTKGIFSEIAVVGIADPFLPKYELLGNGVQLFRISPLFRCSLTGTLGKIIRTVSWYFAVIWWMRTRKIHCLNCHSLPVLPLSVFVKRWKRCKLVYDTHELETETNGLNGARKGVSKLVEKILINRVDAVSVVNKSISEWYKHIYKLSRVWVVHNMPYRQTADPKATGLLRRAIGLDKSNVMLFIYQGMLAKGRGIELLLDVFGKAKGNNHIVFMGYGPLEKDIMEAVRKSENIHFMPAVAPDLVMDYTVDANFGFALMENNCLSNYFSAPNKLYEYATYGVLPIVSNFPEMALFVDSNNCGWKIDPQPSAILSLIERIESYDLASMRTNAIKAGFESCWENQEPELLQMYKHIGI